MYIPRATYRLQFHGQFTLGKASDIIDYLAKLGISDIYASPILAAKTGSTHGYDAVDPSCINPEIGTAGDFRNIISKTKASGLGWVQDIVPNHMSFSPENKMILDILENGMESRYAEYFDIDWQHPYPGLTGKLLAPFLGKFYGDCLDSGELNLEYDGDGFKINYFDTRFPIKIESYDMILSLNLDSLKRAAGADNDDLLKLMGVLYSIRSLPAGENMDDRYSQIMFIKRLLNELYQSCAMIKIYIDETLKVFNGTPGNPESFDLLDSLLSAQNYRLSYWKVGSEEINYRRFFTVNELISLRIENKEVFEKIHAFIFQLVDDKLINGLRIDHIDGLHEPTKYLERLRDKYPDLYIVVEKILELNEDLPSFWPIEGTTGYDYLNFVNGLFCKPENEEQFDEIYTAFTESRINYGYMLNEKKKLILGRHLVGDVDNFTRLLFNLARENRHGNDFTIYGLRKAFIGFLSEFSIYRTYISEMYSRETDNAYLKGAIDRTKRDLPDYINELNFLEDVLLRNGFESLGEEERHARIHFIKRFQQITGPLMAKGFEDTFLYNYNRFMALNDVGSKPSKFGIPLFEFHEFNRHRMDKWPHTMNATSTHDTKRGEDVRARLNVLSEIPAEWQKHVMSWKEINREYKKILYEVTVPEKNDEYLLYQNIFGAFPYYEDEYTTFRDRVKEYIIKAVRESKVQSSWLKPDADYENALQEFVDRILDFENGSGFLEDFVPFVKKISFYGIFNSLSQVLLKMTSPGLPDFYQGSELWDLSFVDPDNRRPVDYSKRESFINEIISKDRENTGELIKELLKTKEDGRIKMFLIYKALSARKQYNEIFNNGDYIPLETDGACKNNIIAFARALEGRFVITIAPRFLTGVVEEGLPIGNVWGDARVILPGSMVNMTELISGNKPGGGEELMVSEVMSEFPAAIVFCHIRD